MFSITRPDQLVAQTEVDFDGLDEALGDASSLSGWDYGAAAIIAVASLVIGRIVRMVVSRLVGKTGVDDFIAELLGRVAQYVAVVLGLIYAMEQLGIAAGPAIGALGIAGIALAFALQDLLENFVAGVLLQIRRPFTSGDEVMIAEQEGTVVKVDARTVHIDTPDGERAILPSSSVIKNPIHNLTRLGTRRTQVDVGVAYGTDLSFARRTIAEALSSIQGIDRSRPVDVVLTAFGNSSIDFAVLFWHDATFRARWQVRDAVVEAIDVAFKQAGIEIPFPQRVVTMKDPVNDD